MQFIESFIQDVVLPLYANTHTTSSMTGHQTSLLRHEARLLIKRGVNANFSHGNNKDCVLFHGSGVTGPLNMMVPLMGLDKPDANAIVFVGPYEHHSNLLPWREAPGCQVVQIPATSSGALDLDELEAQLDKYQQAGASLMIGSFSAASNVTGILTDVHRVASLLHQYGAFAFFDYATAAPYVKIDMNPPDKTAYLDAIFVAPHKFLGGPNTPGLLVCKKSILKAAVVPVEPGGGTVFFVRDDTTRYLRKPEERHEGGTPDVIGSIRAALAFTVKANIGEEFIMRREHAMLERALDSLRQNQAIILLSNYTEPSLPIISFVIQHASGRMLHYNFVCSLLNDLFGIQLRGGCMCAGPFVERLLGMSQELAETYERILVEDDDSEILRPGFSRFNLHYTMSDETVGFILRAVNWVATNGWKLLPEYIYERNTGEFYHPNVKKFPGRRWLGDLDLSTGVPKYDAQIRLVPEGHSLESYFVQADKLVAPRKKAIEKKSQMSLVEGTEYLRWFLLPQEAADSLNNGSDAIAVWDLSKSPLRTFVYENSNARRDNDSAMSVAEGAQKSITSAPDDNLDDMFGVMEEEDFSKKSIAPDFQLPDDGSSSMVCELRPGAMRAPDIVMDDKIPAVVSGVHWHVPNKKKVWAKTRQAIFEFDMIKPGDKVLVCVSGGKDSLSLLHTLHYLRGRLGFEEGFDIGVCTVDPMTVSFDPRPLIPYMAALGVTYHYEQQPLIEAAKEAGASSICSWCSRMKRGIIYSTARKHGYNVVAMGQHLDDMAESFMMSFWLNGKLRTQKACYTVDQGDLRFIRPFCWVREADLKEFAVEKKLPVISESCPACFSEPKERARLKTLLENQESVYPQMYSSMCAAMEPLLRNTPITEVDHERKRELDFKMGKAPRIAPSLLRASCVFAAGIIFSSAFFG